MAFPAFYTTTMKWNTFVLARLFVDDFSSWVCARVWLVCIFSHHYGDHRVTRIKMWTVNLHKKKYVAACSTNTNFLFSYFEFFLFILRSPSLLWLSLAFYIKWVIGNYARNFWVNYAHEKKAKLIILYSHYSSGRSSLMSMELTQLEHTMVTLTCNWSALM